MVGEQLAKRVRVGQDIRRRRQPARSPVADPRLRGGSTFDGPDLVLRRDDPLDVDRVRRAVQARQFTFPIAIDWHWRTGTLHDWWLSGPERPATSVTFILDKQGVIRFIHPGMEYHDPNGAAQHAVCANDMGRIRAVIERLAAE